VGREALDVVCPACLLWYPHPLTSAVQGCWSLAGYAMVFLGENSTCAIHVALRKAYRTLAKLCKAGVHLLWSFSAHTVVQQYPGSFCGYGDIFSSSKWKTHEAEEA